MAAGFGAQSRKIVAGLASFAIVAYCLVRFDQELQRKDRVLLEKINAPTHEKKQHTVCEAFFQARYRPIEIARLTRDTQASSGRALPAYLGAELDKQSFSRHSLVKEGIALTDVCRSERRDYPAFSEALIISTHPRAFEAAILAQLPGTLFLHVNQEAWLSNLYYRRKG